MEPKLFAVSSKLQYAATIMERLSDGKELEPDERENLRYCGCLIEQLDWNSEGFRNRGEHKEDAEFYELCCIATDARPYFYSGLIRIENPALLEREFLDRFYHTLKSGGEEILLNAGEIVNARSLIEKISNSLLEKSVENSGKI